MVKKKQITEEDLKEKFSLNQGEVHRFGQLILRDISEQYEGLIADPDHCWGLEDDINLFKKLSTIVVRLQLDKKLKERS